jgi:hypothetical protein
MDRRAVALILGLVICLVLLVRWVLQPDDRTGESAGMAAPIAQHLSDVPSTAAPVARSETARGTASDTPVTNAGSSGHFRGRVIDAVTRQPVRAFEVTFHPQRRTRDAEPSVHTFQTKDGRFDARLPPGVWNVFVTASGYQRFELPDVAIPGDKAARGTAKETTIPMRPGYRLSGRVFDESTREGVAGAHVSFREGHVTRYEGDFRNRPSTLSKQDGSFVLDGLPSGPVIVSVSAENYASREVDVMGGEKMAPLEIGLLNGGIISGYLAGSDGLTPVAGTVTLANLDERNASGVQTGPAGEFSFTRLTPGRYRLSGRGNGLSALREITLSGNERLEGIVLAMRGGHDIRGVVSGLRPEELQSTQVMLYRPAAMGETLQVSLDRRGAYVLEGVAAGEAQVSVIASHQRQVTKVVNMPDDTDLTLNFELPRGSRLQGRITRGGKPLAGVMVRPAAVPETWPEGVHFYDTRTSPSGEYSFDGVPDGEYSLRIDAYRSAVVRVAADTVFDVDVPASQLAGRLLEQGGNVPVVGAIVEIWPAKPGAPRIRASGRSDHFGQFSLIGLQPGDFVLSVYKPGYELHREPLAYGSPIPDMTIHLRPARGVEFRVRDATSGQPLDSVAAVEFVDGEPGLTLQLNLDQNGVGYVPAALAGSTLKLFAMGYAPAEVVSWNGESREVSLQRQSVR